MANSVTPFFRREHEVLDIAAHHQKSSAAQGTAYRAIWPQQRIIPARMIELAENGAIGCDECGRRSRHEYGPVHRDIELRHVVRQINHVFEVEGIWIVVHLCQKILNVLTANLIRFGVLDRYTLSCGHVLENERRLPTLLELSGLLLKRKPHMFSVQLSGVRNAHLLKSYVAAQTDAVIDGRRSFAFN